MINEEKVIMMTKLASYESGEGKKDISILNYFRNDYIGFQLLKSVISATISFLAIFAVYAFYNFENIMQDIYKLDLLAFGNHGSYHPFPQKEPDGIHLRCSMQH